MITQALRRAIDRFEPVWSNTATRGMGHASPRAAWRWSRVVGLLTAAVVGGIGLAATAAAQVPVPAASVGTMSVGRIGSAVAAVVGLIGVVSGGRALARSARRMSAGHVRRGALVALVAGPIGLVIGGLVVATADGGVGTGNGLGGGVVAMIVGLVGTALGGLALSRCASR